MNIENIYHGYFHGYLAVRSDALRASAIEFKCIAAGGYGGLSSGKHI